jgi:sulfatase-like protein
MEPPTPLSTRTGLAHGARLVAVALAALFSCDVLVNLRFAERIATGDLLFTRFSDLLGLLTSIAPLALLSAAVSELARIAPLARRLGVDGLSASVGLLGGTLGAWALLGVAAPLGELPLTRMQLALLALLLGAALAAAALLRLRRGAAPRRWTLGAIGAWTILPALAIAALAAAVARGELAGWADALRSLAGSGLLFVLLALLARRLDRTRGPVVHACALAVPLAAGLAVAAACFESSRFGRWEGAAPAGAATTQRPDIVLVVLDTVRADHLRRYGYERDTMPELERWADRALVAARAVSPGGWTSPVHASIFSGLTPSQHGIDYAGDPADGLRTAAFPDVRWLPDLLAQEGYTTIAVAANELALPAEVSGFTRSFSPRREEWNGGTLGHLADTLFAPLRWRSEANGWRLPKVDAEAVADVAMRAVPSGGPVFLFVNFMDAHSPYDPPPSALAALGVSPGHRIDRFLSHRELTRGWCALPEGSAAELRDLYDAELRFQDLHLKRLLDWVDARFGADAVVVVTADHGEELGEERRVGHEFGLSQALIHVPLFVRARGLAAGTIEEPVSLRSLFGFFLGVGTGKGASRDELVQGDDLGVLSERARSRYNRDRLGPAYDRCWIAAFAGDVKAVGPSEFGLERFDVGSQGFDRQLPIAAPPASERLGERIDRYWSTFRDRRRTHALPAIPPETDRRLKTIGYGK